MVGRSVEAAFTSYPGNPPHIPDGRDGRAESEVGTEKVLADVLAEVVHVEQVPVDSNFFADLGADSLVMAHFCARVRKHDGLPSVSMKEVYRNPTVRSLAKALDGAAATAAESPTPEPGPAAAAGPEPGERAGPAGTRRYVLCGALQLLIFLGYTYLAALSAVRGYQWISAGSRPVGVYLRSVAFGGLMFFGLCTAPIAVKWVLVGRWKRGQIPVWSLRYVRFWMIKTLVRVNPLALFVGTPLYTLYLRALGAHIGRGTVILSRQVPVCTDLLTVGDGAVVRKDAFFTCYRAVAGVIQTGPVTLGRDAFVGEVAVLDIETSLGDGAQLGHASSLYAGQAVPAGERWHGSPAQPGAAEYRTVPPARCGTFRRVVYTTLQLSGLLGLSLPLLTAGMILLFGQATHGEVPGSAPTDLTSWGFYREALPASVVLFLGFVLAVMLTLFTVPRLLNLIIRPGKVYRLYGRQYWAHRLIARMTNLRFLMRIFGDSSYIVHYLRCLGYDLSTVVQTGSNFGTDVRHETPFLSTVGSGTMVADGLSIGNAEFSSTSFRVSRVSIGAHNFIGNAITYPPQGRTGENCLLGTKVMVPVEGELQENTGLLGSPSMRIPRSVQRDSSFERWQSPQEVRRRLPAKNRHNIASMGLYLLTRWVYLSGVAMISLAASDFSPVVGAPVIALADVAFLLFTVLYFVFVERFLTLLQPLTPLFCSIYDIDFWRRERFWKVPSEIFVRPFNGTPFKNIIWRLLGVRIGKRVFDDGGFLTERALVTIGDDCMLNIGCVIQCHSQEDGTFKSDRTTVGAGCTVGTGALVHYGVTMGDGAVLAPDSFLMKGETMPEHARWGGNPARAVGR